jgi:Cu+-exporting ATPase
MEVEESQAPARSEYQGRTFYFCSESCKEQFDQDPETFADNVIAPSSPA